MLGPILAARISSPEEGTIGGRIVGRCASASVTLADGTTLPLIGGTSVAHQDRSDLEVTFAPAGRLVDALKRVERCVGQGWLGSGNSAKLYQAFFIGDRRHRINYFL
jgi:hypothetical protein